jgi:hypothetical protein
LPSSIDQLSRPIGVAGAQYDGAAVWLLAQILFLDHVRSELVDDTKGNGSKVVRAFERMLSMATGAAQRAAPDRLAALARRERHVSRPHATGDGRAMSCGP